MITIYSPFEFDSFALSDIKIARCVFELVLISLINSLI